MKKVILSVLFLVLIYMAVTAFSGNTYNLQIPEPSGDNTILATPYGAPATEEEIIAEEITRITLTFAGDVLLDRGVGELIERNGNSYIFNEVDEILKSSDIAMVNLENPVSIRGIKDPTKQYTFRAKPEHLSILTHCGIDIVSLANNHILDYGVEALTDTFSYLSDNNILYAGAGHDMDSAAAPVYIEKKGLNIAFLASSRVVPFTSWHAGTKKPGVATTYDPAILKQNISDARKNADVVVVYVHWGEELKETPMEYQEKLARLYIDEGADLVIGSHPHVLQGFEFYKGKLIAYSLGNFIFTNQKRESAVLTIELENSEISKVKVIPCEIINLRTILTKDSIQQRHLYYKLENLSNNVKIENDGTIWEK